MTNSLDWIKHHEVGPLPRWVSSVPGAFKSAWENDNPKRIEQLMGMEGNLLTQENLDKALICALKTDPLPCGALDKFIELDKDIGQRLLRVAKDRTFSQWRPDEVFDFLAKEHGINASDKEQFVRRVVDQVYSKIQQDGAGEFPAYSAMEFLVAALEHPYSRQAVIDRHRGDTWVLLTVAINKRNIQLLEHIEDLEGALRDVLSQRNRTAMVWGGRDKIDAIRRAWSRWEWMVEKSPSLSRAWQTVQEKDAAASRRAREWIKTWIPGGKFAGSPLEKWSQAPDDFHTHPLCVEMLGKLSFEAVSMDSKALQGALMRSFGMLPGERRAMKNLLNLRDVLAKDQNNNPSESGSKWNSHGWINELCVIQPHLLSIAGASGHSALHLAATGTQAGKDELARILLDPRTSDELFSKENCREIMTWLAADKRWNLWRDTDGNTLAHAWILRQSAQNVSWTMLRKLGRLFPEQLTSPNNNGMCLLDHRGLIEEKRRQQLVRRTLEKTAGRHQVKKRLTPKM